MARKSERSKSKKATPQKTRAIRKTIDAQSPQKAGSGPAAKMSLAAMLSVRNGAEALEFYKAAFGVRELFKIAAPDGTVVAQLGFGEWGFWSPCESSPYRN